MLYGESISHVIDDVTWPVAGRQRCARLSVCQGFNYLLRSVVFVCRFVCSLMCWGRISWKRLEIGDTRRGSIPMDHNRKWHSEWNDHVIDDVTWPRKVKVETSIVEAHYLEKRLEIEIRLKWRTEAYNNSKWSRAGWRHVANRSRSGPRYIWMQIHYLLNRCKDAPSVAPSRVN